MLGKGDSLITASLPRINIFPQHTFRVFTACVLCERDSRASPIYHRRANFRLQPLDGWCAKSAL